VTGHPPYIPHQIFSQVDHAGLTPSTSPPHGVPGGQDGTNDDMDMGSAAAVSTGGVAGSDSLLHTPTAHSTFQAGPNSAMPSTSAATGPTEAMIDISSQVGQTGSSGPAHADQPPGGRSPGSS
jgi:hypothetical protein